MSSTQQLILGEGAGGAPAGYQIERSLRFNSADSAYLNRTPSSAGNRKTWTWSGWLKRSALSTGYILDAGTGPNTGLFIGGASDLLGFFDYTSGPTYNFELITTQSFRDVSAWYHIVVAVDTTQATSSNRVKIYLNGSQITAFGTATYPSQNFDTGWNNATAHRIGSTVGGASYFNGYMTEVYFIDGSALTPSSFGETDADTGVWKPKAYSGSYGTNGFYLKFADNSGTTSTTLGKDSSGNGNNWTPNNFYVGPGTTNAEKAGIDSLVDTPTPYGTDTGAGGEVRGNYATWNPLDNNRGGGGVTYTNGNLTLTGNTQGGARSTISLSSGKWYSEMTCSSGSRWQFGIANSVFNLYNDTTGKWVYYDSTGFISDTGVTKQSSLSTCTTGDVIGIAFDVDAGTIAFYKNGTQVGTTYSYTAFTSVFVAAYMVSSSVGDLNCGQRPFAYTPPAGFLSLCTTNLPTPTIGATSTTQAGKYFNTVLYTGTGSSLSVTGVGFQPDFVWIKERAGAADHGLYDAVRGVQKQLESNNTDAETTETTGLTAFGTDGFTVGALAQLNTNTDTYVAWNWKANGAGSTNNAGSIQSTVSANTKAGFSIVTYTGNATAGATVGHGCLVNNVATAPSMIFFKLYSGTSNWIVYHVSVGATKVLVLNTTGAEATSTAFNNTAPSSTVFTLGGTAQGTNDNSMLAYCFAPVAGYSAFGSYAANASADGPFIYTGFRPAFIMLHRYSVSGAPWTIIDATRNPYNAAALELDANATSAEYSAGNGMDILSNGFKLRDSVYLNSSNGDLFIYAAFAEFPFKYSLGR